MTKYNSIVLISLVLCALNHGTAHAQSAAAATLDLPVQITFPSLSGIIESAVPSSQVAEGAWTMYDGWGIKYRIDREAVKTSISGTTLHVSIDFAYRLEACRRIKTKWPLRGYVCPTLASCGHGEGMRRATLTMETHISLQPDWSFLGSTALVSLHHHNRCQITVVNKDVTSRIDDKIRDRIASASQRLDQAISRKLDFLSRSWNHIAQPRQIGELWLVLDPEQVSHTSLQFTDTTATTNVHVRARPTFYLGPTPPVTIPPLPPLAQHMDAGSGEFTGEVTFVLPFDELKRRLVPPGGGWKLRLGDDEEVFTVSKIEVGSDGDAIVASIMLAAPEGVVFEIQARPLVDPATNQVRLENVQVQTKGIDSPFTAVLCKQLKRHVERLALHNDRLDMYKDKLKQGDWQIAEAGGRKLQLQLHELSFRSITVTTEAIVLVFSAAGSLTIQS